ncbi:MAG: pilus assembly protein N-terminal domain-containing protein [Armatimonadota bacterium]|nr:pilus assembly protein N-terminal domain-containing protein [bacterium]
MTDKKYLFKQTYTLIAGLYLVLAIIAPSLSAEQTPPTPTGTGNSPKVVAQAPSEAVPEKATQANTDLVLVPGGSDIIKGNGITRAAVTNPAIADIVPVSTTEVLVNAKGEGATTIRIWDKSGVTTYKLTVSKPSISDDEIAATIAKQIGVDSIKVKVAGSAVILDGIATSTEIAAKAASIAAASGKTVLNLISIESITSDKLVASLKAAMPDEQLSYSELPDGTVMIRGSVASPDEAKKIQDIVQTWVGNIQQESNKNQTTINFSGQQETNADTVEMDRVQAREVQAGDVTVKEEFTFNRKVFGGQVPNGPRIVAILDINPAIAKQVLVTAQILEIDRGKLKQLGVDWGSFGSGVATPLFGVIENRVAPIPFDKFGPMARSNGLSAEVRALIDENAARILSEPKILIADGHTANILVGGEFPIPVAQQANGGGTTITVMFKTFGIQLAVRPRIAPDGRVLMTLTPEVSSLDPDNGVRTADITIPAISTRRATSTVHIANKQTLAIGGLVSKEDIKGVSRIPLISKIPIIGELFKSHRFQRSETELVILVTPEIVENDSQTAIQTPKQ